jgi:NAD+ diphosphatase
VTGQPDPASTGRALDRVAHRRGDVEWLARAWSRGRVVVVEHNRALVVGDPPRLHLVEPEQAPDGDRLFLGVDGDGVPYFAVRGPLPEAADAKSTTLRGVGDVLSVRDRDLLSAAAGLVNWHSRYGFSPLTGEPTEVGDAGWTRRGGDGQTPLFPRTDPAVIVLVNDGGSGEGGRCMLGRGTGWPEGRYSCLAGFVEPGESAEATVVREVAEESGLTVGDVRYVTSQPWPFPGSLMLAFTALGDPAQPLRPDPTELADARWFTRRDLRELWAGRTPIRSSVAYYLMSRWLYG